MFWYGLLGIFFSVTVLGLDHLIGESPNDGLSILSYPSDVYLLLAGAAVIDTISVNSVTIAY